MSKNLLSKQILFIGGGNMATAIIAGLIQAKIPSSSIMVIDHNSNKLNNLKQLYNINTAQDLEQLYTINFVPDIIVLAVKPVGIEQVCEQCSHLITSSTLVISVAAGISSALLSSWLPRATTIVRAMPNTPATIGLGITILYSPADKQPAAASELFQAVGDILWVKTENEINSAMAISGCGPAYVFLICESLMAAGAAVGLSDNISKKLITQTLQGASKLFDGSSKPAEQLRREVTSPNGTTEQAVNILDPELTKKTYIRALKAAVKKAKLIEQQYSTK